VRPAPRRSAGRMSRIPRGLCAVVMHRPAFLSTMWQRVFAVAMLGITSTVAAPTGFAAR